MPAHVKILKSTPWALWVDKPAGLLSVPGLGPHNQDCVVSRVAAGPDIAWAREAHRLDQATSGVMVVALNPEAHRDLMRQFRETGQVRKEYEAVVLGLMLEGEGEISLPIRADIDNRPRQIVDHVHGKPSVTHWQVMARDEQAGRTRLRLRPRTGRTHQLRVHLSASGYPIVGDDLYDGVVEPGERLLLHATLLELNDVEDRQHRIAVHSACPF